MEREPFYYKSISWLMRFIYDSINSKKTLKSSTKEIYNIITRYGAEYEGLLLQLIFEESLKDQRLPRDQNKETFLLQEFQKFIAKPSFLNIVPLSMNRLGVKDITVAFADCCKVLKLSIAHQVILAIALCYDNKALAILGEKLKDYFNNHAPQPLYPYAAYQLFLLSDLIKDLSPERRRELKDENAIGKNYELLPQRNVDTLCCQEQAITFPQLTEEDDPIELWRIIAEIDCNGTANYQFLVDVFKEFKDISEKDLCLTICNIVNNPNCNDDLNSKRASVAYACCLRDNWKAINGELGEKKGQQFSMDNLCKAITDVFQHINWEKLAYEMDQPRFILNDISAFKGFMQVYNRCKPTNLKFPLAALFKEWVNIKPQIKLFELVSVNTDQELLSFELAQRRQPRIEAFQGLNQKGIPFLNIWTCIDFVEKLLELSETDYYLTIKSLFDIPYKYCSEYLLITLVQTKPKKGANLKKELIDTLLPLFFNAHVNSIPLIKQIHTTSPDLVVSYVVDTFQLDKISPYNYRLLDIATEVKELLPKLAFHENLAFSVRFTIMASKKDLFNFDKWLSERIKKDGEQYVVALLNYLEIELIERMKDEKDKEKLLDQIDMSENKLVMILENIRSFPHPSEKLSKTVKERFDKISKIIGETFQQVNLKTSKSEDIEEAANRLYQKVFSNEMSIDELIATMKMYKVSENETQKEIYACMIHNLLDEYRFFHKYPEKELKMTGRIFGSIIKNGLVEGVIEKIAIKYVIEAFKQGDKKKEMNMFAVYSLSEFVDRLPEMPEALELICSPQIMEIIQQYKKELATKIELMANIEKPPPVGTPGIIAQSIYPPYSFTEFYKNAYNQEQYKFQAADPKEEEILQHPPGFNPVTENDIVDPDNAKCDSIRFLINNFTSANIGETADKIKKFLEDKDILQWFGKYLVQVRIATEVNLHMNYLKLIELVGDKELLPCISHNIYVMIRKLLNIVMKSTNPVADNDKLSLKSLGGFLYNITILKNKPILTKELDLANLLFEAQSSPNITLIVSFACNLLGQKSTAIFTNKNPWIKSVFKQLEAIYLKQNNMQTILEINKLFQGYNYTKPEKPEAIKQLPKETLQCKISITQECNKLIEQCKIPQLNLQQVFNQAVNDIYFPVLDRSMKIALETTREIVLKDFANEPSAEKLLKAATQAVQALSGTLAMVTSKEPLRLKLTQYLKTELDLYSSDQALNDKLNDQIVKENLEIGCSIIQKRVMDASKEKLLNQESISSAIEKRKKQEQYEDPEYLFLKDKIPSELRAPKCLQSIYSDFEKFNSKPESIRDIVEILESLQLSIISDQSMESLQKQIETLTQLLKEQRDYATAFENVLLSFISKVYLVPPNDFSIEKKLDAYMSIILKIKMIFPDISRLIITWLKNMDVSKVYITPITSELLRKSICNAKEIDEVAEQLHKLAQITPAITQAFVHYAKEMLYKLIGESHLFTIYSMPYLIYRIKNLATSQPTIVDYAQLVAYTRELDISFKIEAVQILENWRITLADKSKKPPMEKLCLVMKEPNALTEFVKIIIEVATYRSTHDTLGGLYDEEDLSWVNAAMFMLCTLITSNKDTFQTIIQVITDAFVEDCSRPKEFPQRTYFRIFHKLIASQKVNVDIYIPEAFNRIAESLILMEPFKCPCFAYAWLELISCKDFIGIMCRPKVDNDTDSLYTTKKLRIRQLLCKLLNFFKKTCGDHVTPEVGELYDGTIKLFILLAHDYDAVVYENYIDLVYCLPESFTFLRNIILSAHPNNLKIMDPIVSKRAYENKEIFSSLPVFVTDSKFPEELENDYKNFLDTANMQYITSFSNRLMKQVEDALRSKQDTPNMGAYLAIMVKYFTNNNKNPANVQTFIIGTITSLDSLTRDLLLNSIVNELRYPQFHTKFFAITLQSLFKECNKDPKLEIIQEHLVRILCERAFTLEPIPWGLLVLLRDMLEPEYDLFNRPFIKKSKDFEAFLKSITSAIQRNED